MNKKLKTAFTLIELLVVIAIVGILSGLIIVGMNSSIQSATIAKAQVFSNSLRNSLLMNLVSEWKFDGSGVADGGTATTAYTQDSWSGGNVGTIGGAPKVYSGSNCVYGSCLKFDGTNDYIEIPTQANLHPIVEYSIVLWVRAGTLKEWSGLVGNYPFQNGYLIYQSGAGGTPVGVAYVDGIRKDVGSGVPLVTGKWYYIAFTVKENNATKIYINGELKGTTSIPSGIVTTNTNPVRIAGQGSGTPIWFDGLIDEVRIYSAAIPTSQIKEQYYAGINRLLSKKEIIIEEYHKIISKLKTGE